MPSFFYTLRGIFILFFLFATSEVRADLCIEVYSAEKLKALQGPWVGMKSYELENAGFILNSKNPGETALDVLGRDGNYPFFVTLEGKIIISHQVPSWYINLSEPFLASHRGLYNQFRQLTGKEPQIAYSGVLAVKNGQPISFIDQSAAFHQRVINGKSLEQVDSNQARIEFAAQYLLEQGLINSKTQGVNYLRYSATSSSGRGNKTAPKEPDFARFELFCRNSSCWDDYLILKKLIRDVETLGGKEYLVRKTKGNKELLVEWGVEHQFVAMALAEGVMTRLYWDYHKPFVHRLVENHKAYLKVLESGEK